MSEGSTTLGDICEFKYGKSLPATLRVPGPASVYGSNGRVGSHTEALATGPAIIVGRKGSFGEVHFTDGPFWPIDTTYFIDQSTTDCDLRWLQYLLKFLPLQSLNKSAAIPGLNREDAYRLPVEVPSLDEQRRIAAILDKADALRRKRKRALDLLDGLTQSIFLEMFARNAPTDWPEVTIDEIAVNMRTGPFGSQLRHSEFTETGIPVLGIDNAVSNEFRWSERRFISDAKYQQLKRYTVQPRDVLITIMGTCGRCAIVPDDIPTAINTKHLCCITLDVRSCLPEFLHASFLNDPSVQKQLGVQAKGAVMPGLNMGIIKALQMQLPPLAIQEQFVERVRVLKRAVVPTSRNGALLDSLFASLQSRAFEGRV